MTTCFLSQQNELNPSHAQLQLLPKPERIRQRLAIKWNNTWAKINSISTHCSNLLYFLFDFAFTNLKQYCCWFDAKLKFTKTDFLLTDFNILYTIYPLNYLNWFLITVGTFLSPFSPAKPCTCTPEELKSDFPKSKMALPDQKSLSAMLA